MAIDEQPFAEIGARGGPQTRHDLDLMIKPQDVERSLDALSEGGLQPERPPEDWLVKAWDGDTLVDLIYCPKGLPMDDDMFARGEELSVLAWRSALWRSRT